MKIFLFVCVDALRSSQYFFLPGKLGIKCLAQGHTEPLMSLDLLSQIKGPTISKDTRARD